MMCSVYIRESFLPRIPRCQARFCGFQNVSITVNQNIHYANKRYQINLIFTILHFAKAPNYINSIYGKGNHVLKLSPSTLFLIFERYSG